MEGKKIWEENKELNKKVVDAIYRKDLNLVKQLIPSQVGFDDELVRNGNLKILF
jgi:hypothetical protein